MPEKRGGHQFFIETWEEKITADYTGLNFAELGKLNYLDFLSLRRDAFIYLMSRTEKGQEYLDNAWRMEQTEPDRTALREKFGKKG